MNHGRRISREEYRKAVTTLAGSNPREEFDYFVNYRLGVDFPTQRRADLWKASRSTSITMVVAGLLSMVFGGERMLPFILWDVKRRLGRVLTPDELARFVTDDR